MKKPKRKQTIGDLLANTDIGVRVVLKPKSKHLEKKGQK